jgi:cobalt/nickel transport system permease protein
MPRHARIERWSLGDSAIHRRHAAAKILATLALLIAIATLSPGEATACAIFFLILLGGAFAARLPLFRMLAAAAAVLPFALCFAAMSALTGDPARAVWLVIRAYLSSLAAVLLIATTPMPALMRALEWLRLPRFLVEVMQILYRYLFVLGSEALTMRQALVARGGTVASLRFRQAAAAAGVLFARSQSRAEAVHQAMLARGFDRHLPASVSPAFRATDAGFVCAAAAVAVTVRIMFR